MSTTPSRQFSLRYFADDLDVEIVDTELFQKPQETHYGSFSVRSAVSRIARGRSSVRQ